MYHKNPNCAANPIGQHTSRCIMWNMYDVCHQSDNEISNLFNGQDLTAALLTAHLDILVFSFVKPSSASKPRPEAEPMSAQSTGYFKKTGG
ncbi:hypothetical protein L484_024248 [Morus notabilis]|uniref:Uncharacterized protein n=1 Tax=Morus notabilis TaxID=981085 RepID=W9QPJ2_9ROSA|nr:hypothetical protein L484_024248 [Morus notabilis]